MSTGLHMALSVEAYNNMELDPLTSEELINGAWGLQARRAIPTISSALS